ncbi:hypothetical protein BDA96_06G048200 [Sorghum bicolor]|uniref:Uncharacterized protein n=2 Tax=Sorghum bicolor TaxID=4558 RepID=A0A921UAN2_SORBI|nr:hypothetical protein BDA96_07G213200 [Sorghum bicolor]KAG0524458.1 hypothetical protein BDA96_07G213200 [Sorghum bicolor]KAG0525345.1 hypothetical protein BDA96_06G048200 [Sorghum bicolor]KXG26037.1 hypothetical protein SORBI_3006G044000 [Sorghum bicolor]KXG26038.1 hypothetical protein SORBI_3006G044000 [Sorghum bicolor]
MPLLLRPVTSHHGPRIYDPLKGRARLSRPHCVSAAKPSDMASACRLQICMALVLLVPFKGSTEDSDQGAGVLQVGGEYF